MENHQVSTKQEEDGRIFPVSDNGDDVVGIFEKICKNDPRVSVVYKSKISDIYITSKQGEQANKQKVDKILSH